MRENILQIKGETVADTIISRDYHLFRLGTLDWIINSSQPAGNKSATNIKIALGTELLFGEANFNMQYNPNQKFDIKNINYMWRWINNDHKFIKQANLGPVAGPTYFPEARGAVIGASINNASNTVRKTSGSYTITETTEPNWTVELYINDVLIDYTKADAAGLYVFKVPIVYGYTIIKLKFYGPLGEERTEERIKNTPYTFTQEKKLKYLLTTGILQDSLNSRFAKIGLNYGVTRNLTIAAGTEYLSSSIDKPFVPFAQVAYQPFSAMVLNFEYIYQNQLTGLLNLNLTKNAFISVNFTKNIDENINRLSNQLELIEVDFSTPFHIKSFAGFTKLNFRNIRYKSFTYTELNWILSTRINKLKINWNTFYNVASKNEPEIGSNLGLGYRLKYNLALTSNLNYNVSQNLLNTIGINLDMKLFKINLRASYARDMLNKTNTVALTANYNLPFARAGVTTSYSAQGLNFAENAYGSMAFNLKNGIVHAGNNSAIGKGGILLHPFLDLNENGKFDREEKRILISSVKIEGAKAVISKKDSIVRVFDLNAFVNYRVEVLDTNLDNIAWRFKHNTFKINIDPNQYKQVFIPVVSVGEISGMVYLGSKGQGRVTLQILDEKENIVVETLSEFDGYYSYLGLKPGKYTVRIDPEQLKSLNYKALPKVHQITIKVSEYGDIIDGLDFTLRKKAPKKPKE
jgi:hypothetical protein